MKKKKVLLPAVFAVVMLVFCGAIAVSAASDSPGDKSSKYESLDVNNLTGQGQEPEDISVAAAAGYAEKEWYEYLTYCENPVSSYKVDDNTRLVFYDPYDYNSAMVMDVSYDEKNGWSTANSIAISHTFSKTLSFEEAEETSSAYVVEQALGQDYTRTEVASSGKSITESRHKEESKSKLVAATVGAEHTLSSSVSTSANASVTLSDSVIASVEISAPGVGKVVAGNNFTTSGTVGTSSGTTTGSGQTASTSSTAQTGDTTLIFEGTDTVENSESSTTEGWTTVADRVSASTGSTISTNTAWSTTDEVSITKTFDAAYFNSSGSPLSWTIAYYEVKMPMKFSCQVRVNNDWVPVLDGYCLLTTLDGACRAWRENTVTYYEHWGTGEPVADSDFWGQFFTKERLIAAYQNKLYPNN